MLTRYPQICSLFVIKRCALMRTVVFSSDDRVLLNALGFADLTLLSPREETAIFRECILRLQEQDFECCIRVGQSLVDVYRIGAKISIGLNLSEMTENPIVLVYAVDLAALDEQAGDLDRCFYVEDGDAEKW